MILCLERAHGCLGGRSRGAWAAPPGTLGHIPGGPRGANYPQVKVCSMTFLGFFIVQNHVDFDVDFCSFWGRSWVPLGGPFRSLWRLGPPKLLPRSSSNRLIIEKVIFHETSAGVVFGAFLGPQDAPKFDPRSPQDGLKTVLRRDRFSR